jgi:dienelactone hydrolase
MNRPQREPPEEAGTSIHDQRDVAILVGPDAIHGDLVVPKGAGGLVLFAHGSGSSRVSPRNRSVASRLRAMGLATLLVDLLTEEEERLDERTGRLRFDVNLLAERVRAVTQWLATDDVTSRFPIGYFGSSTGAAAALIAATERPRDVYAVVSRGGRTDLAGPALPHVKAPTLLIVGERDEPVLELNLHTLDVLSCEKRLEVVPGATHLFEEPGALETVAELAGAWFVEHLVERAPSRSAVRSKAESRR